MVHSRMGHSLISIHAPAKGATIDASIIKAVFFNFNPRSREGSDSTDLNTITTPGISIHAPAKGATANMSINTSYLYISIHAPAKGATY